MKRKAKAKAKLSKRSKRLAFRTSIPVFTVLISPDFVALERKLHDAGFHATAQLVNQAQQKLGWEAGAIMAKEEDK